MSFRNIKLSGWFANAIVIALAAFTTSCAPRDVSLPSSSLASVASPEYAGFAGATAAFTTGATRVRITWTPSSDSKVVAYNIYDSTLFFSPKLVKTVSGSSSEITLTGLTAMSYYSFRVRAADKDNKEDGNTKDVGAIPYGGVLPAEVASSSSAVIPFNDASNADAALIFCTTATQPIEQQMAEVTNVATLSSATLTGLNPGITYTCRAALRIGDFVDNNTVKTTFTPMGTAASLVFTTQPGSAAAGANLSTQPVIKILDVNGTVVSAGPDSTAIITLTVANSSPTVGSIRGTNAIAAVKGIATFSGLNFLEAGAKIITATKEDTSSQARGSAALAQDSSQFTITPGAVSATNSLIAITPAVPPNSALIANGSDSYVVTITLQDNYNNPISGIKPVFASNLMGDTLTQATQNTTILGQATGSISTSLADTAPPYRVLNITSPAGLTSVTTAAPFVPGTPTKLAFTTQPTNSPAGMNGMGAIRVAVQDSQGNTVTSGASATAPISMAIAANVGGATLYGTVTVNAVSGVATFSDLGISKTATGYKLLATSGSYTAAYSNSFNVTAGTPQKISVTGPTSVLSGACSTAIVFQLQDNGNNPANAVQNTPITISGLGTGALYASSTCSGAPSSANITFTAGTNTKTLYLKDLKGEAIAVTGSDPSNVLVQGILTVNVTPDKIALLAQTTMGATPLTVVAGKCSTAIIVTPAGDNGVAAPLFTTQTVAITGITGSQAVLYSDAACTNALNANAVVLPVTFGGSLTIPLYLKDSKAESLSLSIADPASVLTTTSGLQAVNVLASNIGFTGPTSVVSGACSTSFTVSLKDAAGNLVTATANTALTINGLGSSSGMFYPSSSCASGGSKTLITIPQGSSSLPVYFKNNAAETVTVFLSDPAVQMANSASITIAISPSALKITASPATSKTTVCAGPFTINTMDGANTVTSAISPITVTLSGAGTGGGFYSNATCTTPGTSYTFSTGQSAKTFYFMGQYPQAALTFTASDNASVLAAGTAPYAVTAALGFLGTMGSNTDSGGNLIWFTQGVVPVSTRQDAPRAVSSLMFDSTYTYLYALDSTSNRLLKYNYATKKYIGWIGAYNSSGGIGLSGSNLTTPSPAACAAVSAGGAMLPGWCTGGLSQGNGNTSTGGMNYPNGMATDDNYIFVTQRNSHTVTRYNAATGAFAGWIGQIATTPTGAGPGGPGSCTSAVTSAPGNPTPGWCTGGDRTGTYNRGDGALAYPRVVQYYNGYIYVSNTGSINRYNATDGSFQGWIGIVGGTSPTGGSAGCTGKTSGQLTPGWCTGGVSITVNPKTYLAGGGGFNDPVGMYILGSTMYVVHTDSGGTVSRYDADTGAYIGLLPSLAYNWISPRNITSDGTYLYVADWTRLIQIDSTGLVNGWIGKVSNNNSMSGAAGCSSLQPNQNTPAYCLGGTSKAGIDETAFHNLTAIAYDGSGNVVTGQGDQFAAIKIFNATTGVYGGTLGTNSTSPSQWTNDATAFAQYFGNDDNSMYTPSSSYQDGTYLYVAEADNARIKKFDIATGKLIGSIGAITTVPTGGASGCTSANAMGPSPGWCTGGLPFPYYVWNSFQLIPYTTDGIMRYPNGITGDGTYLYVIDKELDRIQKFNASTGAYIGWVGSVGSSAPTGGAAGCIGRAQGLPAPGWCTGGTSQAGTGDGQYYDPTAITVVGGNLYVVDSSNQRVVSINATTGAFNGWIGRVNTAPTICTTASNGGYVVSTSGWCTGGTATNASQNDRGGGFYFWGNQRAGITNDGTYLYIANFYNIRVDKYSLGGVWQGAVSTRQDIYTRTFSNDPTTVASWGGVGCSYPVGIYAGTNYLYGVNYNACNGTGTAGVAWKLTFATGTMYGWQGAINAGQSPTGGEAGCSGATNSTPGWCQGGQPTTGYRLGQFSSNLYSISGDANYLYLGDENTSRVTRLPK
ncbi:hypothetical protein BH10BDE1_BH10BDE1_17300 [soil metagenome]